MTHCPKCKKYDWVGIDLKRMKKVCMKCRTVWDLEDHELANMVEMTKERMKE